MAGNVKVELPKGTTKPAFYGECNDYHSHHACDYFFFCSAPQMRIVTVMMTL